PLRLLEIGASGGLQLLFDKYRYEADSVTFGDPGPVRFVGWWDGMPPFDTTCTVASREGCDVDPVDSSTDEGRLTLTSFVWPDHHARLAPLRARSTSPHEFPCAWDGPTRQRGSTPSSLDPRLAPRR